MEMATRMQFSREFKVEPLKLVAELGVGVSQAARGLDLGHKVLRRWMRELPQIPQLAFLDLACLHTWSATCCAEYVGLGNRWLWQLTLVYKIMMLKTT